MYFFCNKIQTVTYMLLIIINEKYTCIYKNNSTKKDKHFVSNLFSKFYFEHFLEETFDGINEFGVLTASTTVH